MSAVISSPGVECLWKLRSEPRSDAEASPESVWPFVAAGCCAREIAEWFGLSIEGARWMACLAKRRHLVGG